MKRRFRRQLNRFEVHELDGMRQHLEEMAKKGWFLVELTGAVETFERGEPKPLRYAVELFDRATDYGSRPEGEAQDYIALCQQAGWHFCGSYGKVHVFSSEQGSDILPIETDLYQKYRTIRKELLRSWASNPLSFMVYFLGITVFLAVGAFPYLLASALSLFVMGLTLLSVAVCLVRLFRIVIWCRKAKRTLALQNKLPQTQLSSRMRLRRKICDLLTLATIFVVCGAFWYWEKSFWRFVLAAGVGVAFALFQFWVAGKKLSRDSNQMIAWGGMVLLFLAVFLVPRLFEKEERIFLPTSQAQPTGFPITLEDTGETLLPYRWSRAEEEKTFLAGYTDYQDVASESPEGNRSLQLLYYSVYQSRYPALLEWYTTYRLRGEHSRFETLDAQAYGAEFAYYFDNGLLLGYPQQVVWFWPMTEESERLQPEFLRETFSLAGREE